MRIPRSGRGQGQGLRCWGDGLALLPPRGQVLAGWGFDSVEQEDRGRDAKRNQSQTEPDVVFVAMKEVRNEQLSRVLDRDMEQVEGETGLAEKDPLWMLEDGYDAGF